MRRKIRHVKGELSDWRKEIKSDRIFYNRQKKRHLYFIRNTSSEIIVVDMPTKCSLDALFETTSNFGVTIKPTASITDEPSRGWLTNVKGIGGYSTDDIIEEFYTYNDVFVYHLTAMYSTDEIWGVDMEIMNMHKGGTCPYSKHYSREVF